MRLFLYYAAHTFKNQLKKIFKSWLVIMILAFAVIGGIIGFTAGMISEMAERRAEEMENERREEEIRREEEENAEKETAEEPGEVPAEAETPVPSSEEMIHIVIPSLGLDKMQLFELIAGALLILLIAMEVMTAEKSGAKIFLPADVNLLFPSPMKPQNVLMFRLVTRMGLMLLLTLYMFLQMPNLTLNLGLSIPGAVSVIVAWGIFLILMTLIQAFLYVFTASRDGKKNSISTGVYLVLGIVAAFFLLYFFTHGRQLVPALNGFFNAPESRFVPLWGWLKGFFMYTIEGNYPMAGVMLFLLLALGAALLIVISRMKADFYEDAMAKSEETAELMQRAKERGGFFQTVRKKDRSEKLMRDGLNKGFGANVIFYKTVYNRHRFAVLRYFTKTSITYTVVAVLAAVIFRLTLPELPFTPFILVALILSLFVFYRSLGNPLDQDTRIDFFRLIPESTFRKLMFSLLGGSYNCLLDLVPGMLLAAVILEAPLYWVPAFLLFSVTFDAYSTTVATFIDLAVPQNSGRTLKQMIQVMFLYFGIGPVAVVLGIGLALNVFPVALVIAGGMNVGLSALFLFFCSLFLAPGRGR